MKRVAEEALLSPSLLAIVLKNMGFRGIGGEEKSGYTWVSIVSKDRRGSLGRTEAVFRSQAQKLHACIIRFCRPGGVGYIGTSSSYLL